jgi:hypothetical protein
MGKSGNRFGGREADLLRRLGFVHVVHHGRG